ncbi:MAG: STAS domain-containing protein [Pirellulales bacterium]
MRVIARGQPGMHESVTADRTMVFRVSCLGGQKVNRRAVVFRNIEQSEPLRLLNTFVRKLDRYGFRDTGQDLAAGSRSLPGTYLAGGKRNVDVAQNGVYDERFSKKINPPALIMSTHNRITLNESGDVSVVNFVDRKILDETNIQELGRELFGLVENGTKKILLNFSAVEFLSSAALGKLITLDKKVKNASGQLRLSDIRPEIYEVFAITRLNKLFEIHDSESGALETF